MEMINWSIRTSTEGISPEIISEFLLNDLGIFVKREKRVSKKAPFMALTGFRVGYTAVPGQDYRSAPMDRCAILWHKITSLTEIGENELLVKGNKNDVITIAFLAENKNNVIQYIKNMQKKNPVSLVPDYTAASWLCWRDDDDWGNQFASLVEMVQDELQTERFIEPEILDETDLTGIQIQITPIAETDVRTPSFCSSCGVKLIQGAKFCGKCGSKI